MSAGSRDIASLNGVVRSELILQREIHALGVRGLIVILLAAQAQAGSADLRRILKINGAKCILHSCRTAIRESDRH